MTNVIISSLVSILSNVKLNKISDRETKTTLIRDYLTLKQFSKKAEEAKQELIQKFQEDWREEIPEVDAFRRENKPVEGHDEFLKAEADTLKMIKDVFSEEEEVKLTPVDLNKFVDAVGEEGLTLEAIAFLQENGVIV